MNLDNLLKKTIEKGIESTDEIKFLLLLNDVEEQQKLFDAALKVKEKYVGRIVRLRGLIEVSNICSKDCLYCGIRCSNRDVDRFTMSEEEILNGAKVAIDYKYGSIVLQSGENQSPKYIEFIENILRKIKKISNNSLGITLSLGEQTFETYKRWFEAGAHRYLLRIESSTKELYNKLHPKDHIFEDRLNALNNLKKCGYQLGTGVMFGLPHQSIDNLVSDLMFFKKMDVDMLGMGPYIIHHKTPLGQGFPHFGSNVDEQLQLSLKMIAVARLFLRDINIASTTALQTLVPNGRELGLLAGANVIMPNIGDVVYRKNYLLYENKPNLDENSDISRKKLEKSVGEIGETIEENSWGDSPHALKKSIRL